MSGARLQLLDLTGVAALDAVEEDNFMPF